MKIIFLIQYAKNTGGMVQSVISIINGLSLKNLFQVILVSPNNSEISKYNFSGNIISKTTKEDVWPISRNSIFKTFRIAREIKNIIKPYLQDDYIFLTNDVGSSLILSFMPLMKKNEIYVNRGGDLGIKAGFGGIFMRMKIFFNQISFAIATSRKQEELLINCGMRKDKVTVIYNGLDLPKEKYKIKTLNRDLLRISVIGYISDLKNQIEGVRLIKLLRDNHINAYLFIYGAAESSSDILYKIELDKEISKLGLNNYIVYKGFVKGEKLFNETDIHISFSKSEGFGRTIVEGMLRYIPVIAYKGAGGPVDITNNGIYGQLVEINEAPEYYNKVMNLLLNQDWSKCQVEAAYDYALKNFTSKTMVNNYINFFQKINDSSNLELP